MIVANVLAQLDLRSKTPFLGLQFSLLATLTWGTYLDLRRQQSFSGRRSWAARILCYVPSLFFMMVIYFQQPTSKGEIYFYLGWIVSALSAVSLLPIFKDSHCIPPDANERRLALPQEYSPWQYSPWRSALRISLKSLIAGLIVYVIIYHLQSAKLFQHLKAEQVQQRAFSILSKLQREYDFSFRYDHKLNEILEITLTPATPPDLLSHLPFSTIQRTSVLTISGIQPNTQIPTLNTAQTGLQIVDSRLTIDQLQSILDNCALLGLTRCEIVADAGQVPQVGASGFMSSDLPMEFTELAPGNIARVLAANSTSYRGAISIRASKLDQNDLIALLQAPNTLKSYYTSSDDLAILEDTVQQLPTKVRGQSPSLRVNVMGEIDLSPENYPNLWQRALAGDLLLVHATENLSNFYLSGFVQQPSGNLHQPKPLLSFLTEGPNDSGFMFSTAQLREMHWLNPSDDKPENRDKLDTLWLPNVMFLNHIEPELLHSLTKLSLNSRRFGQVYNERWDNERQVSAEKILATLDNLECLEIGGVYSRNTNLASLPNNLKVLESSTDLPLPYDLILSGRRLEKIILTGGPPKGLLQELSKYPKIQFVLLVPRNHAANAKRDLLAFNAPHIKLIVADHTYESLQTSWYQFHQLMIQRVRDRVQAAANSRSSQPPK
jgi:hypothetical protein